MTQWGLDVLFNPAKRHMDDEKQRLQSTREEVGDASDGKRIDLASGKVVIRRKAEPAAPAEADSLAEDADRDAPDDRDAADDIEDDDGPADADEH